MDTTQDINTVEWFFGYGGNHLGLKRVLPNLRLLAACEIEEFAVENILAKMEAGLLEAAPIWSDCKTFPWEPFVDRTHLFVASYPCQPFSAAGKRQGADDERHLWPYVYRWILRARPLLVFLENVEGHVSLGLSTVISDLEEGGYKATWGIFSASEVGAPHQRKRVFILAYRNGDRFLGDVARATTLAHSDWAQDGVSGADGELANGQCQGLERFHNWHASTEPSEHVGADAWASGECGAWPSRPGEQQFWWEPPRVVVDTKSQRAGQRSELRSEECGSGSALSWDVEQSGEGAVANDHSAHAGHGEQRPERTLGDLSGGCGEELDDATRLRSREPADGCGQAASGADASSDEAMGHANSPRPQERSRQRGSAIQGADADGGEAADGKVESSLGGNPNGPADWLDDAELYTTCDNRTDELRLLGNGVVPATAERAFRVLITELAESESWREPANG